MTGLKRLCSAAALLVLVTGAANIQADHRAATLAVIMTNDLVSNQIKVYDVVLNIDATLNRERTLGATNSERT